MKKLVFTMLCLGILSCQNHERIYTKNYKLDFDKLMLQIVPFIAKLHDSIAEKNRLNIENIEFIKTHIEERQYKWLNFYEDSLKTYYFQISRLEPSIKNDKFSAICGSFKLSDNQTIDKKSFKEIYWTWKMRENDLAKKSEILFKEAINQQSLDAYQYPKASEDWIEFPSDKVIYNTESQSWITK